MSLECDYNFCYNFCFFSIIHCFYGKLKYIVIFLLLSYPWFYAQYIFRHLNTGSVIATNDSTIATIVCPLFPRRVKNLMLELESMFTVGILTPLPVFCAFTTPFAFVGSNVFSLLPFFTLSFKITHNNSFHSVAIAEVGPWIWHSHPFHFSSRDDLNNPFSISIPRPPFPNSFIYLFIFPSNSMFSNKKLTYFYEFKFQI